MNRPLYYGLRKDGTLRQYVNKPKCNHVVMTYTCGTGMQSGTTAHFLKCGSVEKQIICHCGYDRGPKLDRFMIKMLKGE